MINRICIFDQDTIDRIEKCPGCDEARKLTIECDGSTRRDHCDCVNNEAPDVSIGVNVILLAEAPPPNGRYLMNRKHPKAKGGDSLGSRVVRHLRLVDGRFDKEYDAKGDAIVKKSRVLDAMKRNGYTFIDCCQCKIPDPPTGPKMPLLRACFKSYACGVVVALCTRFPEAVVQPYFKTSYKVLKECGLFYRVGEGGPFGSWRLKPKSIQ